MAESARDRTLQRMKRLLAFTTAVGATACGHSRGYDVVDPMPPPPRCPGVAKTMSASAAWGQGEVTLPDGTKATRWTVVVTVSAPTLAGAKLVPPSPPTEPPPPDPNPLVLDRVATPDGGVVVTLDAFEAHTRGWFGIECQCDGAPGTIGVYVDAPQPPGSQGLTVQLGDS